MRCCLYFFIRLFLFVKEKLFWTLVKKGKIVLFEFLKERREILI